MSVRRFRFGNATTAVMTFLTLIVPWTVAAPKQNPSAVQLSVRHNGQEIPPPDEAVFSIDGHSIRVPIKNGIFDVPSKISKARTGETIGFRVRINGDQILTNVGPQDFLQGEHWTLILEDKDFGARFSRLVSKDTPAISGCAIIFSSKTGDGVEMFDAHCRAPIKKQ